MLKPSSGGVRTVRASALLGAAPALALVPPAPVMARTPRLTVIGPGAGVSCAEWAGAELEQWAFSSASTVAAEAQLERGTDPLAGLDADAVHGWLGDHRRRRPQDTLSVALVRMVHAGVRWTAAMGYRFGQSALDHPAASIAAPTFTPAASTSATTRRWPWWCGSTASAWPAVRRRSSACQYRLSPRSSVSTPRTRIDTGPAKPSHTAVKVSPSDQSVAPHAQLTPSG